MASSKIYTEIEGHFLLARLNVKGIFARSVVWVVEFSEGKGARGFILNRPTGKTLGVCSPNFAGTPLGDVPVLEGGPVGSGQLCFVLRSRASADGKHHVRVGVRTEEIRDVIFNPGVRAYGFVGRAEWAPGQLEDEISRNTWMRMRMDADAWDAGGAEDFWRRLVAKIRKPEAELMLSAPSDLAAN